MSGHHDAMILATRRNYTVVHVLRRMDRIRRYERHQTHRLTPRKIIALRAVWRRLEQIEHALTTEWREH